MNIEFKDLNRGDTFRLNGESVELVGYSQGGLMVRHTRENKPMTWIIKPELTDTVYKLS